MTRSADIAPEVIAQIVLVDPAQIDPDVPGRIGQFFPLRAEGLAARIGVDGQQTPILIAKSVARAKLPWRLVAGWHRMEACRLLGRAVRAEIVTGSAEKLRQLQAAENLDRREMTALERAMFVAAVAEAAQARLRAKHGVASTQALGGMAKAARVNLTRAEYETAHDRAVRAEKDAESVAAEINTSYGWRGEVQDACGLNVEALKRSLRIYRGLVVPHRELMDRLRDHPIANNAKALLTLAGRNDPLRGRALEWLAEHPEATTADAALVALGAMESRGDREADRQSGQTEFQTRAEKNLELLTPATWRSWAPALAEKVKPSALVAVRDALDARIAELRKAGKLGGDDGEA